MRRAGLTLMSIILCASAYAFKIDGNRIKDEAGNSVEKKKYEKIVVMDPAVVEAFYMINGESSIAAVADTAMSPVWPQEKTKSLPKAGNVTKPSFEKIISFEPDLVIVGRMSSGISTTLKERGINFLVNEGGNLEEILDNIKFYGILTGQEEKAEKVYQKYSEKLEKIRREISEKPLKRKGAILYSTSPMMVFNSTSLPGEIFKALGIENIADNLPGGRPILSPEYLVSQNPDLLLGAMSIKNKEEILNSSNLIRNTKAGKSGDIFIADSSKILRPTPRVIDALEDLYRELKIEK